MYDAIGTAGVSCLVLLTARFAPEVGAWVNSARAGDWAAGTARWLSGALLDEPFAHSPWRHERGGLVDIGPHLFDLLEAALGPVVEVPAATHGEHDVWQVMFAHDSGALSTATMSIGLPIEPNVVDLTLYGRAGRLSLPERTTPTSACYAALLDELAAMVGAGRTEHPLDVRHGLHLQRLIDRVERLALG